LAFDKNGNLYAGGFFPTAGGVNATNIAKWNGSTWSALGSGVGFNISYEGEEVYALACDKNGNLYAGGGFSTAGGVSANNIAEWNGSTWTNLGSGIYDAEYGDKVYALACDTNGNLYAGGDYLTAGGIIAYSIAKWNGSTWSALGTGLNGPVFSLACDTSGNLYVGGASPGAFSSAGGQGIAKWNGNTWSTLGSGMSGGDGVGYTDQGANTFGTTVNALALDGFGSLYASGNFYEAGTNVAYYVAEALLTKFAVTTIALPNGINGVAYNQQLSAVNGQLPYSWSIFSGSLPPGLMLASSGLISGTPTNSGTFNFAVKVTDALSATATQPLTLIISIRPPLQVTTTALPNGTNDLAYSQQLSAVYGQLPYSWSIFSGSLPSGLALATNGLISGMPTNSGTFNFTVKVADALSVTVTQALTLTVIGPPSVTIQPTNNSITVTVGSNVSFEVSVAGISPFSYQWQLNGTNLPGGIITTVAGNGTKGYSGDGGAATNAELYHPMGVAVDTTGNLFIGDYGNNRIRKVGVNGTITTVAGNGTNGYSGDGGAATNAELNSSLGAAADASGNLFIADYGNNRIRKVGVNGIITTVAGNGTGSYSGDGGVATNAELYNPYGVAVDASRNLFIADTENNVIRKVGTNGIITTVAGNGNGAGTGGYGNYYSGDGGAATNAELNLPVDMKVDDSGNVFIADYGNNRIRKVGVNGIITTVAGNGTGSYSGDGGAATNAELYLPHGVAVDALGNLFIADLENLRIREVGTNGIITTVAGNGTAGYSGDGGAATNAELYNPYGVAVDASGNLFIADSWNSRIRKVVLPGPTLVLNNVGFGNAGAYDVVVSSPYGSVTSSVVNLSVTLLPPVILSAPQITVGKTNFTFLLSGPAGSNYVLQVSTNLLNWSPVSTSTIPVSGSINLSNATSGYKQSFYRAYLK
jgi:hypothetical protein